MKTNILIIISVFIIVLFNGLYFLYNNKYYNNDDTITSDIKNDVNYQNLYSIIADNLLYQINEDGISVENIDVYLKSGSSISLRNLTKESKILVLRFSELNCDLCVIDQLNHIKKTLNENNKVILLASYSNSSKLKVFLNTHQVSFPYYTVREGALGMEIEKLNFPFYFVLGEDLQINQLFLPSKSLPEITEFYLTTLLKKGIVN